MSVLVTGAAGFIGMFVARAMLKRGERVVGVDCLNDYYDVSLKRARLQCLADEAAFIFAQVDLADQAATSELLREHQDINSIVHLAGQPGVRYSLENPLAYVDANIRSFVVLLESARRLPRLRHLVYASSSSVYGRNAKLPFTVGDATDKPLSFYGASKKAMEVTAACYAASYPLCLTGLRLFTVYGPWGRPDMAPFLFIRKILAGETLPIYGHGNVSRDFTYIDDIVSGIIAALDRPPAFDEAERHRLFNLGSNRPESVLDLVHAIETTVGRSAHLKMLPLPPGDATATHADIEASRRILGFAPQTPLTEGIRRFADWYRQFYDLC